MALLICPDCQKEVSEQLSHCIHCGCPLNDGQKHGGQPPKGGNSIKNKLLEGIGKGIGGVAVVLLVLYFAFDINFSTIGTLLRLKAPSCGDEDVKNTVLELVETQSLTDILSAEALSKITFDLKLVRTTSVDKEVGSQTCAANLSIVNADGLNLETPNTYYSQLGEKRGEFVVSVSFERPEDIWGFSLQNLAF